MLATLDKRPACHTGPLIIPPAVYINNKATFRRASASKSPTLPPDSGNLSGRFHFLFWRGGPPRDPDPDEPRHTGTPAPVHSAHSFVSAKIPGERQRRGDAERLVSQETRPGPGLEPLSCWDYFGPLTLSLPLSRLPRTNYTAAPKA